MATKSMSYDHPAYRVPHSQTFVTTAGASGVGAKFMAFTTTLLKSATITLATTGTLTAAGNMQLTFRKRSTNGTSSVGFINLNPFGTATVNPVGTQVSLSGTLAKGEQLVALSGTDATMVAVVTYEFLLSPGADVTD